MKIPFLNRPETRASYTDAIVEALLREATGGTTASVSSLGVVRRLAAGLVGQELRQRKGKSEQRCYGCIDAENP